MTFGRATCSSASRRITGRRSSRRAVERDGEVPRRTGCGYRRRRSRYGLHPQARFSVVRTLQDAARHRRPLEAGGLQRSHPDRCGAIQPGDFIAGDHDGVVVIPRAAAEEVVTQAEQLVHTENLVRKAILEGVHPVDAFNKYREVLR